MDPVLVNQSWMQCSPLSYACSVSRSIIGALSVSQSCILSSSVNPGRRPRPQMGFQDGAKPRVTLVYPMFVSLTGKVCPSLARDQFCSIFVQCRPWVTSESLRCGFFREKDPTWPSGRCASHLGVRSPLGRSVHLWGRHRDPKCT
jgi:hypothetical protein